MFVWQTHELYMIMSKCDKKKKLDTICMKKENYI